MSIRKLLAELKQQGIVVQVNNEQLTIKSTVSPISPDAIRKLKQHKQTLIGYLKQLEMAPMTIHKISDAVKSHGVGISIQQLSLWPLYQMGQAAHYNIPVCYALPVEVNTERLCQALIQVYQQHDALHSIFVDNGEQVLLRPRIDTNWQAQVELISPDSLETTVIKAYQQEQARQFDLVNDTLFVARLLDAGEQRFILLNFPHIIMDGWSIGQLWQKVNHYYVGDNTQTTTDTETPADYCDYLAWLSGQTEQHDYWQTRLQGYVPFEWHSLSHTSHININSAPEHLRYSRLIPEDVTALRTLAQSEQVSMFCAALYLWSCTLSQFTGQNDIVVSTPYVNREQRQLLDIIGYLVSMIPVRYQRQETLKTFQQHWHQDLAAAHCDFNALLNDLDLVSEGGRHPLQQSVFSWQDGIVSAPMLAGAPLGRRETTLEKSKFPLNLSIVPLDEGYQLKWEYDPAILSSDTIEQLETLFIDSIRSQGHWTRQWPEVPEPTISDSNVITRLLAQVQARGEATALIQDDEQLTYQTLWTQSLKIAGQLQHIGVKPGERVGLCLPRGIPMVIGLVGIVMAGGVYVPLSEDDDNVRLAQLASRCQMRYCLTGRDISDIDVLTRLSVNDLLQAPEHTFQPVLLSGTSPMYINFSSGTTGEPKGICCVHQGVIRLVCSPDYMHLDTDTCMLSAAALTFDAFTLELWGPLLNGGQVQLLSNKQLNVVQLQHLITDQGVNTLWLTAALFHTLVDIDVRAFSGLQQLLVGGDVISPGHVQKVYASDPDICIINGYGPTENTTFTCCYTIPRDWPVNEPLPVGTPIRGTGVCLLNVDNTPVLSGCVGEIVATGAGLAAGYLDPQQEIGRFVELELPDRRCRAYRTGDMGYVDSLGRIRFLGRADQQVKINGFRVELEAINRALSAIDGIKRGETIAITPNKPGGAQRLVGFVQQEREVVPDTSEVTDVTELLTHLSPTLPGYMLPGVLLSVTEWPLTRTGKVDRNTLQAWYEQWLLEHQLNTRSLTPTERQITKVWESVLGCKTLNHSAHFYQLGGNSLLLLKAHNELVRVFQQQIDLSLCLQNPILSELAEAISSSQTTATVEEPEVQLSAQSLFPLTTEQKRLWLTEIIQPSIAYNIPIFLPVPKTINYEQIQTTVNQLVKANPALGLKLVELNGEVSQQIRSIDDILVEHISVNTAQLQKCKVGLGQKAINLAEGVMCAHFIETDTSNHWLVLNIHHICFDGQSLLPLITAFNQLLSGRSIERDLGFFQHIQWQQTTQYRELIQEQKKYWQDRLAALEAPTVLPYLSQPNESRKSRNLSIPLDPTLVANITQLARELNTTEFTLWSSLTTLLLGRLNQVNYATLVTPVAKRLHAYESESIGFFANTLLLHSAWTESISFRDFISQKHTEITNDLCHQLVSLGTLLSMQKQQGKEIDTLSEVLFSMTKPELGNNELEVGVNPDVKFDLGLTLSFSTKGDYAQIEYRKSAYSINMLEKTVEALLFLAQQVHANPDVSIGALELTQTITKTELGCSNTFLSVPKQIINLAHRHENEIAVTDGQTELTYHMLVESAQRMAVHLQHAGIKKGDRVAVLVRRQAMLPVTLLAILITGAVYVPLDPEYPVSRNQYILYDAQPSVVIYDIPPDTFSGELPSGLQWISLPSLLKPLPNIELQPVTITADDLSHIIYTSGSTGQPKGVAIRHDGLASLQEWAKSVYVPEDFSLVYSGTSICFDLSVFEIFITWSLGGSVYFAENSLQLVDDMHKHAISLLNVVPSILTEVLKHQSLSSSIRIVNLAGEPLPPSLAKALYKQSEHIRVFNLYGPSEDTTYSTWFEVEKEKCDDMLIGQPLPGTQAIISDHSGRLLPDYFVGELYLSGRGLAKGYWNKPDLNEERFIRHNNGQVFYKTGDLVRRVEQQQLEYIGRIDDQVKLRGFRIELEEISHLVLADEQVLASCTLVIKHDDTDQIVCFFVSDERDVNINRLKERLKKNLPNYMVPTHFQQIEKMPTTPSGKQDKKALNTLFKPYSNCAVTDDEQNHSEYVQWCCSQFTSFLPDKKVGYESDFFESGGTPSLASSLLNRIRTDFSVKISFEKLSSNSNPVSLGELIESLIELQEELNNEIII